MDEIILPTVRAMAEAGTPFKGVLYAGLMIGSTGPEAVEYNCRFGDPECQVLMMRLKSDIVPALIACADGGLKHFDLRWSNDTALTVVMAAKGYPDAYQKGSEIRGLDAAAKVEGVQIFHAGTKPDGKRVLANGGRVLNVTAVAPTVEEARDRSIRTSGPATAAKAGRRSIPMRFSSAICSRSGTRFIRYCRFFIRSAKTSMSVTPGSAGWRGSDSSSCPRGWR